MSKKNPVQKRATVTRESIVEAGLLILAEDGAKNYTTNKIAERAGVSIGSLYQYFPNKESMLKSMLLKKIKNDFQYISLKVEEIKAVDIKDFLDQFASLVWVMFFSTRDICKILFSAPQNTLEQMEVIYSRKLITEKIIERLKEFLPDMDQTTLLVKTTLMTETFMGIAQTLTFVDKLYEQSEIFLKEYKRMITALFE